MSRAIMIIDDGPEDSPVGTLKVVFIGGINEESFAHRLMVVLQDEAIKLTEADEGDTRLELMTEEELEAVETEATRSGNATH